MRTFTIFNSFFALFLILFLVSGCGKSEVTDFSNQEIKSLSKDFLSKVTSLSMTEAELDKELPRKDTADIWTFLEEKGVAKYLADSTLNPNIFDEDLTEMSEVSKQLYNEILPLFILYKGYEPGDFIVDANKESSIYQVTFKLKKESASKGIYKDFLFTNVERTFSFALAVDEDGELKISDCSIPNYGETKEKAIENVKNMNTYSDSNISLRDLIDASFETNKWSIRDDDDTVYAVNNASNPATNTEVMFEVSYFDSGNYNVKFNQIIRGDKKLTEKEIQKYIKELEENYDPQSKYKDERLQDETDVIVDGNTSNAQENTREIEQAVVDYGYALVDAINNNDFSIVEPYLLPDSNLYSSQVNLVDRLFRQNITESIYEINVISVNKIGENRYEVETFEDIGITSEGEETNKKYQWVYTVENVNGQYLLSDIRKAAQ
jgi:hypothetical protein